MNEEPQRTTEQEATQEEHREPTQEEQDSRIAFLLEIRHDKESDSLRSRLRVMGPEGPAGIALELECLLIAQTVLGELAGKIMASSQAIEVQEAAKRDLLKRVAQSIAADFAAKAKAAEGGS